MIQKNIRVSEETAKWMDNHPVSNNALVNMGLHLLMQMEANLKAHIIITPVTDTPLKKDSPF